MIDEKIKNWLIKHYKHTENNIIMAKFGLSNYFLHKYAKELGLKKSRAFMLKVARANSAKGFAVIADKGWPPKGYIIPNHEEGVRRSVARTKGKKQKKKHIEKRVATMNDLRKKEKRRVLFGLEQRTKLKVIRAPKYKIYLRHKMRQLGYLIVKCSNTAFYGTDTKRNPYYENKAKEYGINIENLNKTL